MLVINTHSDRKGASSSDLVLAILMMTPRVDRPPSFWRIKVAVTFYLFIQIARRGLPSADTWNHPSMPIVSYFYQWVLNPKARLDPKQSAAKKQTALGTSGLLFPPRSVTPSSDSFSAPWMTRSELIVPMMSGARHGHVGIGPRRDPPATCTVRPLFRMCQRNVLIVDTETRPRAGNIAVIKHDVRCRLSD